MNTNKINLVNQLLDSNVGNRIVTVEFIKKDGSLRKMQLLRSKSLESAVKGTKPDATAARKWTLSQNGMKCVEELTSDKKFQWRTINLNTVKRIAVNGSVTSFAD